jgi:hypothetical protein
VRFEDSLKNSSGKQSKTRTPNYRDTFTCQQRGAKGLFGERNAARYRACELVDLCDSPTMYGKLVAFQREIRRRCARGAIRAGASSLTS